LEVLSPANDYSEKEENLLLYDDLAKKKHLYPKQQSCICKQEQKKQEPILIF
jgi:hypothetical protein